MGIDQAVAVAFPAAVYNVGLGNIQLIRAVLKLYSVGIR